jgi:AcrR family transcriptional regulator
MGVLERKSKEKELRKKAIIDAARKTFFKNGYNETSVDNIANSAQLSKGTIYLYFKSKDEIYISLLIEGLMILYKIMNEVAKNDLPTDEKLILMAEEYYNFSEKHKDYFNIMLGKDYIIANNSQGISNSLIEKANDLEKDIYMLILNSIENGIKGKFFIEELSSAYTVIQLWASITGAIETLKRNASTIKNSDIPHKNIIIDISKTFIISYARSQELRNKYRNEILANAAILCNQNNISNKGVL